jgi:hypothetical protein
MNRESGIQGFSAFIETWVCSHQIDREKPRFSTA